MYLRIGRPDKSVGGVAGNARAEGIGGNSGPWATRWMMSSNEVLKDVAKTATKGAGDGK